MIRAVEGPLANIQDLAPEATKYPGHAEKLSDVWIAVRACLRRVLERVTIADLRDGKIPDEVLDLTEDEGAWVVRQAPPRPAPVESGRPSMQARSESCR